MHLSGDWHQMQGVWGAARHPAGGAGGGARPHARSAAGLQRGARGQSPHPCSNALASGEREGRSPRACA